MIMDSSDFVSISELADEGRVEEDNWNYALMNYLQKLQTGSREDLNHYYGLFYPFSIKMEDGSFWLEEEDIQVLIELKESFYSKLDYGEFKFTHNVDMGEEPNEDYQMVYQQEPVKKWEFKLCFNPLYIEMYEAARRTFVRGNGEVMSMKDFFMMLNDDEWFQYAGWRVHKEYEDGFIDDYFIEEEIPAWVNIGPNTTYGHSFIDYILSNGWEFKNPKLYRAKDVWLKDKDLLFLSQGVDEIANLLDDNGITPPGNDPIFANEFYWQMDFYYERGEIYTVNPLSIFLYTIGEIGMLEEGDIRLFSPLEIFRWRNRSAEFMQELWKDIEDGKASFIVFIREFYTDENDEYPVYGNQSISLDIIDYEDRKMILNDFVDKYSFLPDFIGFKQHSRPQTFINYSLENAFRKV
jgi:hypothetical protein